MQGTSMLYSSPHAAVPWGQQASICSEHVPGKFIWCLLLRRRLKHKTWRAEAWGSALMALMWCRLWQLSSVPEPAHPQPGWVCAAWCCRAWPGHGSTSLLLWEPSVPPLTTLPWPWTGVFTGCNLLLWLCLVELPGCFNLLFPPPSWSHLLWCSSQASSESWAGWNWGICPFFSCFLSLLMFLLELRELWCQITPSW